MTDDIYLLDLPKGWIWASFGGVADYINGRAFKPSEWEKNGRPIIRIQNLTGSTNTVNHYSKLIEDKFLVSNGDLLISWSATLGAFIYKGEEAVLNQHIFKVRPYIDKIFLFYLTTAYIEELRRKVHGTGMQHITKGKFEESFIPLPPLPEQHRIVAKIEELFTNLDAGVSSLKKAKAQLKRYRQAVLKSAFEGRLTEEWREAHKGELEPASMLLERIKEERKKNVKRKYKELPSLDISDLPDLSDGWVWTRLGEIFEVETGSTPRTDVPEYWEEGNIRWITPKDLGKVSSIYINDTERKITDKGLRSCSAKIIPPNSIIISTRAPIGYIAILAEAMAFNQGCKGLVKINEESVFTYYFYYLLLTKVGEMNTLGSGSTFKEISKPKIHNLTIPLPSPPEQHQIVSEIERRLSVADETEKTVKQSLKQSERLRQSILKKAFEGKLVPQDPSDLPASMLLERIKEEKAKDEAEKKSKSKRKKGRSKEKYEQMRLI